MTGSCRLVFLISMVLAVQTQGFCPEPCTCSEFSYGYQPQVGYLYGKRVNCSLQSLTAVPEDVQYNRFINVLQLSLNNISALTNHSFVGVDDLVILYLDFNNISEIESGTFMELEKLVVVSLSWNKLSYLHPDTFSKNEKLLILDLSYNNMLKVPSDKPFLANDYLLSLSLAGCNLHEVSEATFLKHDGLVTLDVSSNNFEVFELSILLSGSNIKNLALRNNSRTLQLIGKFPSTIEKLDLSGTSLDFTNFPSFPHRCSLEALGLNGCNLTTIPKGVFEGLTNLEELQLSDNRLSKSDLSNLKMFRNLKRIYLDNNTIDSIDIDTLDGLYLWKLVLSMNPIDFPEKGPFLKTPALQTLEMRSCSVTHIGNETLKEFKILNYTDLSHNHIKRINSDAFSGLDSLQMLLLQNNEITVIEKDAFLHNIRLSTLNLSGNPLVIPSATAFLSAPSLKTLYLASCGITQLPAQAFSHSPFLTYVDISNNKLRSISDKVFSKAKDLKYLNMSGNPFVCDYQLAPIWLLCLDRDIECRATCGSEMTSWDVLVDVSVPSEVVISTITTVTPTEEDLEIRDGPSELPLQQSGRSVASTVALMICLGLIVGVVVGLIAGCLFLQKYLGIHRNEETIYHSVAAESINAGSLQQLCVDDRDGTEL